MLSVVSMLSEDLQHSHLTSTAYIVQAYSLLSLSSSRGRQMSGELQLDVRQLNRRRRHLVNAYEAGI